MCSASSYKSSKHAGDDEACDATRLPPLRVAARYSRGDHTDRSRFCSRALLTP
jgi:hypothetical protein